MPTGIYKRKPISEITKQRISLAQKDKPRPFTAGEKHGNWSGGRPKCSICSIQLASRKATMCKKHVVRKGNKAIFKKCLKCTNEFKTKPSNFDKKKYCSTHCSRVNKTPWNKGKKGVMPETWNKGMKGFLSGEKSPHWKGGITKETIKIRNSLEMKLWRKSCFDRDNFTCQKTGERGGKLVVHHINNFADFPELRTSISNGITLSGKSHMDFHKKYGKRNNTHEQLEEFLMCELSV